MRFLIKLLFLMIVFLLNFSVALAVQIGGVNGGISNGQAIIITGSDFGSKSGNGPLASTYDHPNTANNLSNGTVGGNWNLRHHAFLESNSNFQRTPRYQSSNYVNCEYRSGYATLAYDGPSSAGSYFYTSFWYLVTEPNFCVSVASSNSKFWRWYVNPTGGTGGTISASYFGGPTGGACGSNKPADSMTIGMDGGQGDRIDYHQPTYPLQEWVHHEVWAYAGSNNNTNGRLIEKVNGKKVRDWSGWGMINSSHPHTINYFRFGQVSGSNYAGGSIIVDSAYIDNTQAHVFISDRSTMPSNWLNTTTESYDEIQVCSQWSTNQITCTINQGNFASGQSAYLYVVDSSGNVNTQGYPITFGGSGGDDLSPPGDVTDFVAQPGDGQITLSWTNPTDTDFSGTMLRYSTGNNPYPATNNEGTLVCDRPAGPGSTDSFIASGLSNCTKYNFSVFTYDDVGNFYQTAHVSATPTASVEPEPFPAPKNLRLLD